ncbi:MAG: Npt1/Npt2 family nucleotide transporter [Anaerolineae bacterium]
MQSFLRRLLNVQPGEGRKLAILYLLVLVIGTSLLWGASISRALFLKRLGVQWLPLMYILSALLTFPITVLYTSLVDRVSNLRLLRGLFASFALVLAACWILLLLDGRGVAIPYVSAIFAILFLVERIQGSLLSVHTWTLFNDYYDLRAAKRTFPILGSAARAAGILGAPLVIAITFVPTLQGQDLILAWVAVLVVGIWMSLMLPRWLKTERTAAPAASTATAAGSSPLVAYWHHLRSGFRYVSASSFLKLLALGAFAMTAVLALVDFQASAVFERAYPTDQQLVIFYSVLQMATSLVALPIQMFLVSRLVSRIGVGQANLVYPVGGLLSYAALATWPVLGTAIAGQFVRDAFRAGVQAPIDNMLYNAVPPAIKGRARAFVRGLLLPLAEIGIGLVLWPVRNAGFLSWWLIVIGALAAVTHIVTALAARRQYTQALVTMLEDEDFLSYRLAGSELGPPDPATFRRLVSRMASSEDEDTGLFLARIVAEVGGREAVPPLMGLLPNVSTQLQAGILETLLETDIVDESLLPFCQQALSSEDAQLRRAALAALERLMGADNPELWPLAATLLADPDPEARLRAILLLVRCGDFFYLADAVNALNELLSAGSHPDHRTTGLRILQTMDDPRMVRNLVRYLHDPDDRVRLQAMQAIETLADPEAPAWATSLAQESALAQLDDPVEGVRLSALRTLGKVGGEGALQRLLVALGDASDLVREQATTGLLALGQEAIPSLEQLVQDPATTEREQLAAARILAEMGRERTVSLAAAPGDLRKRSDVLHHGRWVHDLYEDTLQHIYADARIIAALADLQPAARAAAPRSRPRRSVPGLDALLGGATPSAGPPARARRDPASAAAPATELIADGLRQRNERRLTAAFGLLSASMRDSADSIQVISRTLTDPQARDASRTNALEALESVTSPRLARLVGHVTPWQEGKLPQLIDIGREEWDLAPLLPDQALELILLDPDRWLAAIGIFLAGQVGYFEQESGAESLRSTWLPQWQADPDPAVQEAGRWLAHKSGFSRSIAVSGATGVSAATEAKMEDTPSVQDALQMGEVQGLSVVEKAIFLKQIPFFAAMTVDQLRTLAGIVEEQYYEEGDVVFAEGEPGEALYVVVSGRVGIEREPKQGRVQRLETLTARQYFGEQTIFDGAPNENRAVAVGRVHLLSIRREPLLALIRRSPDLSMSLVMVLSQRLREADSKLAARTRVKPDQVMKLYDRLTEE